MMFEVMNITFFFLLLFTFYNSIATTSGEEESEPKDQAMSLGYKAHGEMINITKADLNNKNSQYS